MPHEPPQPSSPQALFTQLGVQPHTLAAPPPPHVWGSVHVPQSSEKPVQSPSAMVPQFLPCAVQVVGVQQMPNRASARPGGGTGFMQWRLQQLMFVAHRWPSGLQPPSALAARGPRVSDARTVRAKIPADSDTRARFIGSPSPLPPASGLCRVLVAAAKLPAGRLAGSRAKLRSESRDGQGGARRSSGRSATPKRRRMSKDARPPPCAGARSRVRRAG